jgi:hypothetical protein
MRIDNEHGFSARRMGRSDSPGIRFARQFFFERRSQLGYRPTPHGRVYLALHALPRTHVTEMNRAADVQSRRARDWQHHPVLRPDCVRRRFGVIVHAARELIQVLPELRILRFVPRLRQFRHTIEMYPFIELEM